MKRLLTRDQLSYIMSGGEKGEAPLRVPHNVPKTLSDIARWLAQHSKITEKNDRKLIDQVDRNNLEETLPFRTRKDRSIRRSRIADVLGFYKGKEDLFWQLFSAFGSGCDYILVCNLLLWARDRPGLFSIITPYLQSADTFNNGLKPLSDQMKVWGSEAYGFWELVEITGLTGYRTLPYPGFDPVQRAEELTNSKFTFGWQGFDYKQAFSATAQRLYTTTPSSNHVTFEEWLSDPSNYALGGSAQLGGKGTKVKILVDGKEEELRMTKGQFGVVTAVRKLLDMVWSQKEIIDKVIAKEELSKIRIAISSDLVTFFKLRYLQERGGKWYLTGPYGTLDLNARETLQLYNDIHTLLQQRGVHTMPWDYKTFDHQMRTWQVQGIVEVMIKKAIYNETFDTGFKYDEILSLFDNEFLHVDDKGKRTVLKFKSGLGSGLAITSVVGTVWNEINTHLAIELASWIRGEKIQVEKAVVRGDDSLIISRDPVDLQFIYTAYLLLGVEPGKGKFSVQLQQGEFLRVWFDKSGGRGYLNRAIPGLVQRKPWREDDWSEENIAKSVKSQIDTIARRGFDFSDFWQSWKVNWAKRRRISYMWLTVPSELGGFGIEPDRGFRPSTTVKKYSPEITLSVPFSDEFIASAEKKFMSYGNVSTYVARIAAERSGLANFSANSNAAYRVKAREGYNKWVDTYLRHIRLRVDRRKRFARYPAVTATLINSGTNFGTSRRIDRVKELVRINREVDGGSLLHNYSIVAPDVEKLLRKTMQRYRLTVLQAEDWLAGKWPGVSRLHPLIGGFIANSCAALYAAVPRPQGVSFLDWTLDLRARVEEVYASSFPYNPVLQW